MELIQFDGLPDTIETTFFKWCLYVNGKVTFFRDDDGQLLALNGVPADHPDIYYIPKNVIVNNPVLIKSYDLKRNVDCVVVYCTEMDKYNFDFYGGLSTLLIKTATMLADNNVSINVAQKNTRLHNIIAADDENTKNSVEVVFKKMYNGEPYSVVQSNLVGVLQSVPFTSNTSNSYLVQLVELHQYILAHFYEAIGIQTHDNMKKERLITAELDTNPALMQMNINNIFNSIQDGIKKVNEMFGTSIEVRINPLLDFSLTSADGRTEPEEESASDVRSVQEEESESASDVRSDPKKESEPASDVRSDPEKESELASDVRSDPEEESEPASDVRSEQSITININDTADAVIEIIQERGEENGDISDTNDETSTVD